MSADRPARRLYLEMLRPGFSFRQPLLFLCGLGDQLIQPINQVVELRPRFGLRGQLPKHAQEIYQAAFNNAWEEYHHNEERAHRVAWAAVKKSYQKNKKTGRWTAKA